MSITWPTTDTRWRCSQCGNLTRFDVVRSSRVKEYVHLDLSGEPAVEDTAEPAAEDTDEPAPESEEQSPGEEAAESEDESVADKKDEKDD